MLANQVVTKRLSGALAWAAQWRGAFCAFLNFTQMDEGQCPLKQNPKSSEEARAWRAVFQNKVKEKGTSLDPSMGGFPIRACGNERVLTL